MAAPPSDPPKETRQVPKEIVETERIEKMTRSFRADAAPKEPPGAPGEKRRREYRARTVLSFHRFLGRWTAP